MFGKKKKKTIQELFTAEVEIQNKKVEGYQDIAPKIKKLVEQFSNDISSVSLGIGYNSVRVEGDVLPSNFYCFCETIGLHISETKKDYYWDKKFKDHYYHRVKFAS